MDRSVTDERKWRNVRYENWSMEIVVLYRWAYIPLNFTILALCSLYVCIDVATISNDIQPNENVLYTSFTDYSAYHVAKYINVYTKMIPDS